MCVCVVTQSLELMRGTAFDLRRTRVTYVHAYD